MAVAAVSMIVGGGVALVTNAAAPPADSGWTKDSKTVSHIDLDDGVRCYMVNAATASFTCVKVKPV